MKAKLIYSKYRSTCSKCGKPIKLGDRIYWQKGLRPWHENCGHSDATPTLPATSPADYIPPAYAIPKPTTRKYDPDFSIDWPDFRQWLIGVVDTKSVPLKSHRHCQYVLSNFKGDTWHGGTMGQTERWLKEGYKTDAIKGLDGLTPPIREKRRVSYSDEGDEFHIDLAYSGSDNYMSEWTKREVIPGVRLNIELDASAGSSNALFAYQKWMAKAIYALEASGVDCEVEIFTLSRNLFQPQKGIARTAVRVKKEGEIADFLSISPMLSPVAFRTFMFSNFSIQAEAMGLTQTGFGSGVTDTWSVVYNAEMQSVDVSCHWDANSFPEDKMTFQLREAIKQLKG